MWVDNTSLPLHTPPTNRSPIFRSGGGGCKGGGDEFTLCYFYRSFIPRCFGSSEGSDFTMRSENEYVRRVVSVVKDGDTGKHMSVYAYFAEWWSGGRGQFNNKGRKSAEGLEKPERRNGHLTKLS